MISARFTITEYQNYIQQSNRNHLLVEGKDDRRLFSMVLEGLFGLDWRETRILDIDSAEDLLTSDDHIIMGNREKVEEICLRVAPNTYANRLVGFVDREFRDFVWDGTILDTLETHKIIGRLVWSRGHSIENYFFDYFILREPLRELSITDRFNEALALFEECFDSALRLASIVSLVGRELGDLNRIKASIDWRMFEVDRHNVNLQIENWRTALIERQHYSNEMVQIIIQTFWKWFRIVEGTHPTVVRWVCHGHIGLTFIWAIYARCIYQACIDLDEAHKETEAANALNAKENLRFNVCAGSWIRNIMNGRSDYPRDIIRLFNWG